MKTPNINWSRAPSNLCYRLLAKSTCSVSILLGLASTSLAQPALEPPEPTAPTPADVQPEAPSAPDTGVQPAPEAPAPPPADVQTEPPPPPPPVEAQIESLPPPPPPAPTPTPPPVPSENAAPDTPGFATMDRANGVSFIEVTGAFTRYEGDQPDFNFRSELYGQYVAPSGIGGYAAIPFAVVAVDDETASGVAHFEFGGIYNIVRDANTQWVLRGGILTNPSDDPDTFAANVLTSYNRVTDLISIYPESSWLRLSASHLHRSGKLFVRSDGGLDVNIDAPDGADFDSLMRLNFGAGLDMGGTIVAIEMVTVGTTGDVDDGDRFITNLALSFRGGRNSGYDTFLSLVLPVDEGFMDMGLLAGMRFPLGS